MDSPELASPHTAPLHLTSLRLTSPLLFSFLFFSPHLMSPHFTSRRINLLRFACPRFNSPRLASSHLISPSVALTSPPAKVSDVRIKFCRISPALKRQLVLPLDRALLTKLEVGSLPRVLLSLFCCLRLVALFLVVGGVAFG